MRRIDMPRCDSLASPVQRLVDGFDLGEPAGVNGSLNHLNEARCSGLVLSAARGTTVFHVALRLFLIGSAVRRCKTICLRFSAPVKAWSTLGLPVDGARSHLTYQEPAER